MAIAETTFAEQVAAYAAQLNKGHLAALGCLYDLTSDRLIRYARTLLRNPNDAEDALQASLVRIAQHPVKLAQAQFPWAYCLRIVRNEALKVLQRRTMLTGADADQLPSHDERALERAESAETVRTALSHLPPEQAEVVVLKVWESMTFAEIAVVLSESPNTVASRYRYALEKLTRLLEPLHRETKNPREIPAQEVHNVGPR